MAWRIVKIDNRAKLDYKMGYLVCRREEETIKVFIDEIAVLIIENTSISITAVLMNKLIENKVKVIFCDAKRNPSFELMPYYGSHDTSNKIRKQVLWEKENKAKVWSKIIEQKITNQVKILEANNREEAEILKSYISEVELGDESNREGFAAKVYFNAIFGKEFTRNDDNTINAGLDYGYSILLSLINREITAQGYITQLGIHHNNMFNHLNLGSDLVEPLRMFVDKKVITMNHDNFTKDDKYELISILNQDVRINNKYYALNDAVEIYCRSIFEAIESGDVSDILFIEDIG